MNTFLSSSQESLRQTYRTFALNHVAAKAQGLESRSVPLQDFLSELSQAGYLGIGVPQEYGGQAGSFLDLVMLVEAIAEYEPGLGLTIASHAACSELIKEHGTDLQKSRYLPQLARGETIGALAFSEEKAGTDFAAVETMAVKESGNYLVSGCKTAVVNGQVAGLAAVLARIKEVEGDTDALTLLLAEISPGNAVEIAADRMKLGLRSAYTNDLTFKKLPVPIENVLPSQASVQEQVLFAMDIAKVVLAAAGLGLLEGALKEAAEHAKSRQQFGKNIGQFQAIQWKLADLSAETAGARLQTYRAAWARDNSAKNFRRYAAMCKWLAARTARIHSGEALQILGAAGLSSDCRLERFYRDAKTMEIAEGTSEFQKMLLVEELGI